MAENGLTAQTARELLDRFGPNTLPEVKQNFFLKLLKRVISPISLMLLAASALSYFTGRIFDAYFILVLFALNLGITFWQENKADNAIKKLNQHLATSVKTLRDGVWKMVDSALLVPGDVIELSTGDVVPADGIILSSTNVTINESALTGESLPKEKNRKDTVYGGSFLATGLVTIAISATGAQTYFGKTLFSIERSRKRSFLEQDVVQIAKFLSVLSVLAISVLSVVFFFKHVPLSELLTLDLSLMIAGIPISLPTVMTLIIEFGVLALAQKNVIVRRLSALEELANVNLLLTDKTGTLTYNRITIQDTLAYDSSAENVLGFAYLSSKSDDHNLISKAIVDRAGKLRGDWEGYRVEDFTPADSERKRSTTLVSRDKEHVLISVGAPQIIAKQCDLDLKTRVKFQSDVAAFAGKGYRTLAVATTGSGKKEEHMRLLGVIALSDTIREDAKQVIDFMRANGITVAMLTGDNSAISEEVARRLDLNHGKVISKGKIEELGYDKVTKQMFQETGAFAEILPDDKLKLVQAAKKYFVVAANGDGVNDLPAVKEANVGIAVKTAVDALRATADIVLLTDGIAVIRDAILESRKIFQRVYTYSLYRISESLRLIITIAALGIFYQIYPLTPLQIILIALLNDIPIISLAFDRVKVASRPSKINVKERFILSSLYGLTGIGNSLILFVIMVNILHLDWRVVQTIYFLKITVSGHMLIYVAHTKQRWFKFLPSREVILATTITQLLATVIALTGLFMPAPISLFWVAIVWIWSFLWMQVAELSKIFAQDVKPVGQAGAASVVSA